MKILMNAIDLREPTGNLEAVHNLLLLRYSTDVNKNAAKTYHMLFSFFLFIIVLESLITRYTHINCK